MTFHYPVLGSTSDLSCREGNLLSQSEALPRSFLRDHFVGKPVAVSVFSLNFSSVGKGSFMDGKAKNIYFSKGRGGGGTVE